MSLTKIQRCGTCLKTDDEVDLMLCPGCEVMLYCSMLCERARRKKHNKDCIAIARTIGVDTELFVIANEAMLEIAMIHDNYDALERAVEGIYHAHLQWITARDQLLRDTPDLICFHIELGNTFT